MRGFPRDIRVAGHDAAKLARPLIRPSATFSRKGRRNSPLQHLARGRRQLPGSGVVAAGDVRADAVEVALEDALADRGQPEQREGEIEVEVLDAGASGA